MFTFRSCQSALKSIQNMFEIGSNGAYINLHNATYSMNKTASWIQLSHGLEPLLWILNLKPSYTKFIYNLDIPKDKHIKL